MAPIEISLGGRRALEETVEVHTLRCCHLHLQLAWVSKYFLSIFLLDKSSSVWIDRLVGTLRCFHLWLDLLWTAFPGGKPSSPGHHILFKVVFTALLTRNIVLLQTYQTLLITLQSLGLVRFNMARLGINFITSLMLLHLVKPGQSKEEQPNYSKLWKHFWLCNFILHRWVCAMGGWRGNGVVSHWAESQPEATVRRL